MSRVEKSNFDSFLCDTWWYGLTHRFDEKFELKGSSSSYGKVENILTISF